jgi:hypothetical protein
MNPGQIEHVGWSVTDFIAGMSELIDQINDTVFQIDLWQTQNERRNGIKQVALRVRKFRNDTNAVINLFEDFVIGTKTGCIFGLTFIVEFRWI